MKKYLFLFLILMVMGLSQEYKITNVIGGDSVVFVGELQDSVTNENYLVFEAVTYDTVIYKNIKTYRVNIQSSLKKQLIKDDTTKVVLLKKDSATNPENYWIGNLDNTLNIDSITIDKDGWFCFHGLNMTPRMTYQIKGNVEDIAGKNHYIEKVFTYQPLRYDGEN